MILLISLLALSFNTESSVVYRNRILSSNLYLRNSFGIGGFNFYPEAGWSGKKNLVSGMIDEKTDFSLLSRYKNSYFRFLADFSRVENFSSETRTQSIALTAGKEIRAGNTMIYASLTPTLEIYTRRTDTLARVENPGAAVDLEVVRSFFFADVRAGLAAEVKKLTKRYTARTEASFNIKEIQNHFSGRADFESYPSTGGRTRFNRYEFTADGRWNFFRHSGFFAESYWKTRYLAKKYPESDFFSNEDFFAEGGCFFDLYLRHASFRLDFSQGYGVHSKRAVGEEDIVTSKLLFETRWGNQIFSAGANGYMSIYRFFQNGGESYGDYDVSDRGAGLNLSADLNRGIYADCSFLYRENSTVYISENYSESNTVHRTYSLSAGAFLKPFDFLTLRQISTIKTDYTFFVFASDRNVIFRKYENKIEITADVADGFSILLNGIYAMQDRGGYKKTDENVGGKWYFLRNRHLRSFDAMAGVKMRIPGGVVKPYGGIEEKTSFHANGEELTGVESYAMKGYAGLGMEYSGPKGQAVLELRRIMDKKSEDQWEANLYLIFWF